MPVARAGAEQRLEKLALAVPLQAADAEHLALAQVEADARRAAAAGEVPDLQRDRGSVAVGDPLGIEPVEVAGRSSAATISSSVTARASCAATVAPLRKMVSRSATPRTSAMRCEMKMTSRPSAASSRVSPSSHSASRAGSAEVASSRIRTRGVLGEALGDLDDLPLGERQAPQLLRPGRSAGKR